MTLPSVRHPVSVKLVVNRGIYHLEAPIDPVFKWKKALSTAYAAYAGWVKERRALPLKLMQLADVQDSCFLEQRSSWMSLGKSTCLAFILDSVENFGGCGAQDAFTCLSIQST